MRKALVLGTVASAVVAGALAAQPASAAAGDTTVTFVAGTTGSTVSILPSAAVVGVASGNTVTGAMTSVITDLRVAGGGWTDTISSTDFGLVGATTPSGASLVPASAAKIYNTAATVTVPGTATVTNNYTSSGAALALANTGQTLLTATTTNVNVTTVLSTIEINVTGKTAGAYAGTITQTVS